MVKFTSNLAKGYLRDSQPPADLAFAPMRDILIGFAENGFDFTTKRILIVTWRERDARRNIIPNGLSKDFLFIGDFDKNDNLVGKHVKIGISPKIVFPEDYEDTDKFNEIIQKYPIFWGTSVDGVKFMTAAPAGEGTRKKPSKIDFQQFLAESTKGAGAPAGLPSIGTGQPLTAAEIAALPPKERKAYKDAMKAAGKAT